MTNEEHALIMVGFVAGALAQAEVKKEHPDWKLLERLFCEQIVKIRMEESRAA